jgi:nicotinamide-nucleotide amidase
MKHIINQIHKCLFKKQKTVAIAESCTGGLASSLFTQVSGSSKYFILGVVVYSNKSKENILKIPAGLIAKKGAVSPETTKLMARSVRKIAAADFGIGITGFAGPTAARSQGHACLPARQGWASSSQSQRLQKPVGTVFIAIDSKDKKIICEQFHFKGRRSTVRKKAALKALELLKRLV